MGDKSKFHNMTKPIKFRRVKLFKQYIVLWCKALRERIKYSFNYLLYKLNILKRYSYRDDVERVLPLPHKVKVREIETSLLKCTVVSRLVERKHIDFDYFYKEGEKRKVTLYVKNEETTSYYIQSHTDNIYINVFNKWYSVSNLPIFKYNFIEPDDLKVTTLSGNYDEPLTRPNYKTVELDIDKIRNVRFSSLLGIDRKLEDISVPMVHYYYNSACKAFDDYLNSLKLEDLMCGKFDN